MARYIDAEAAIDAARRSPVGRLMIKKHNLDGWLLGLPAADVAPVRHGEWADDASCPFCGFKPWYENDIRTLSFCPNCGAKMDGGDGDD